MDDLTNFKKTLDELKKFLSIPIQNDRDIAGIIQAFEFTFEQSWKAIQKVAAKQGTEIGSPKKAFSFAMQNKWINPKDENSWLQLLKGRNLTSHTYEQSIAKEVLDRIQKTYITFFVNLYNTLEKEQKS